MNPELLAFVVVAVIVIIFFVLRRGMGGGKIQSPRLGFLNLKGVEGEQTLIEDKNAFASMFSATQESTSTPPPCDVLFIYCNIELNGRIAGSAAGLRELIRDSGARVAVVASENPSESLIAYAKTSGRGHSNLVLTLKRKGSVFPTFFSQLFAQMMKGTSMPIAWVKLAPQIPGHDHADCPETIFLPDAGQVAFK